MKWAIPVAATSGLFFDLRAKECMKQLQTVVQWETFCEVVITADTSSVEQSAHVAVSSSDFGKNYNLTIPLGLAEYTIIEIKQGTATRRANRKLVM